MKPDKKEEITYTFPLKQGSVSLFKRNGEFHLVGLIGITNLLDAGLPEIAATLVEVDKFIKENE